VALLLLAFLLNLFNKLSQRSRTYALLNIVGAGLACYASYLIDYIPFVVLEGAWFLVAVAGLVKGMRGERGDRRDERGDRREEG